MTEPALSASILATAAELVAPVGKAAFSLPSAQKWLTEAQARLASSLPDPDNKDLVKAIRTAHLCALRRVVSDYKELIEQLPSTEYKSEDRRFNIDVENFVSSRLQILSSGNLDVDRVDAQQTERVLKSTVDPMQVELNDPDMVHEAYRRKAEQAAIVELEEDAGRSAPPLFTALFSGAYGASWYDHYARFLAEQIKTNPRFQSMVSIGQLALVLREQALIEERIATLVKSGAEDLSDQVVAVAGDISELALAFRNVAHQLGSLAESQRRLSPRDGQTLTATMLGESTTEMRLAAVGDRITWKRLCAGVYMPRPKALAAIKAAFVDWYDRIDSVLDHGKAPVFWIDGRSGDGKSVLLMQLAHQLLSEQPDAVMFQPLNAECVPRVLDYALACLEDNATALIVIDDLHRLADPESWEAELIALLESAGRRVGILACGPSPEREVLDRGVRSLVIDPVTCPPLITSELQALGAWFGRATPTANLTERDILVEILFEMKAGEPIPAFARSFRRRLEERDLFDIVAQALAVNVFGAVAPLSIIDRAHKRAALEELAREDQLHFEIEKEHGVNGFRMVHGRIAWRVFEEWALEALAGADVAPILAERLADTICVHTNDDWPYVVALLTSVRDRIEALSSVAQGAPMISRLRILTLMLQPLGHDGLWSAYVARTALLTGEDTTPFPEIALAAENARTCTIVPGPIRIRIAIDLCVRAPRDSAAFSEYLTEAQRMFLEPEVGEHIGSYASILFELDASSAECLADEWCNRFPTCVPFPALNRLRHGERSEHWCSRLLFWLDAAGSGAGTQEVLVSLLTTTGGRDDVVARALAWLDAAGSGAGTHEVLRSLLPATGGRDDVVTRALAWLDAAGTGLGTQEVLRSLLTATGGRDDVVRRALTWIEAKGDSSTALWVRGTLVNIAASHPAVCAMAGDFVRSDAKRGHRAHVLGWWLHGGGVNGAAIDAMLSLKREADTDPRKRGDFSWLPLAAGNSADVVLEAAAARPEDAADLCFLLGRARPDQITVRPLGETLLAMSEIWPDGCEGYLWRTVVLDRKVDPAEYRGELRFWFGDGFRRGFSEVVSAFMVRDDVDAALLNYMPPNVRTEVARRRER